MVLNERTRFVLRKIYVLRAGLFGLLYGLIFGVLFIGVGLWVLWSYSVSQGLTPPNITSGDIVVLGVVLILGFTIIGAFGIVLSAILYNLLAKLSVGLHFDFEEREMKDIFVSAK